MFFFFLILFTELTHQFLQRKEVYCKVRASLSRLLKEADRIDLKMPLDPVELRKICSEGREVGYCRFVALRIFVSLMS